MEHSLGRTAEKTQQLLDSVRTFLQKSENGELNAIASEVPLSPVSTEKPLSIAFVGPYSAGKSSILNLLTGSNLAVGEKIVTNETCQLSWNGITVIDTPGIHTGIRPDHDAITYSAISKADLIIYVVTQTLFEPVLIENFRKLAFGYGKKNEMMLVVNKMNDTITGNTLEMREMKLADLRAVLAPAAPEDFLTTFISAENWFEAQDTDNERRRQKKLQASNIDEFIANLNKFSAERNLNSRFTTNLYALLHLLEKLQGFEKSGDVDVDCLREQFRRRKLSINQAKNNIERRVENEVDNLKVFVRQCGAELANSIDVGCVEADFEDQKIKIDNDIKVKAQQMDSKIQDIVQEELNALARREEELQNSDFGKQLMERLEVRLEKYNAIFSPDANPKIKNIGKGSEKFGETLAGMCTGKGGSGLAGVSGSTVHDVVIKVGHLLGHKFKPWEALKWTKAVSNAAKGIAVVGAVISIGMQAKEDYDQYKLQQIMRENRDKVRNAYIKASANLGDNCKEIVKNIIKTYLKPELDTLEQNTAALDAMQKDASEFFTQICDFRNQTLTLIAETQKN